MNRNSALIAPACEPIGLVDCLGLSSGFTLRVNRHFCQALLLPEYFMVAAVVLNRAIQVVLLPQRSHGIVFFDADRRHVVAGGIGLGLGNKLWYRLGWKRWIHKYCESFAHNAATGAISRMKSKWSLSYDLESQIGRRLTGLTSSRGSTPLDQRSSNEGTATGPWRGSPPAELKSKKNAGNVIRIGRRKRLRPGRCWPAAPTDDRAYYVKALESSLGDVWEI
jgi:hypothetical protein